MNKNGFTLVELAIVLVIIGLLIGRVLIGQSLIDNAKINKFVTQVSNFDIAVNNFKSKYNKLPGDSDLFNSEGNGDGSIDGTDQYMDGEVANFWRHLSLGGFQPEGIIYQNTTTDGVRVGTEIPKASFGAGTSEEDAGVGIFKISTYPPAPYYYCDFSTTTSSDIRHSEITLAYSPIETLAIDTKMDDGYGHSVSVDPSDPIFGTNYTGIVTSYPSACRNADGTYPIEDTKECCIWVSILGNQQDLK